MKSTQVVHLTNKDKHFYSLLGPFLANRNVHQFIGLPPWDDEGKEWFLILKHGQVHAFGGITLSKEKGKFHSDYIIPEAREHWESLLFTLIVERSKWATGKTQKLSAVVMTTHLPLYKKHGFVVTAKKTHHAIMEKSLT